MSSHMNREAPSQEPNDDRPTKRLRTGHQLKSAADEPSNVECGLPPELWALVMPFMPYSDNIRCSILNKTFLKEVASRVKRITVFSPNEMKIGPVARRFSAVEIVYVACLYRGDHIMHCGEYYSKRKHTDFEDVVVSDETVRLTAPFLSAFPSLKQYDFGGYVEGNNSFLLYEDNWAEYGFVWKGYSDDLDEYQPNGELMRSLMLSLCGAYRSGLLQPTAMKETIWFLCSRDAQVDERCSLCCTFFEDFPLKQAASLTTSIGNHCRSIRETFEIVIKRPGGKKALSSVDFFLSNFGLEALEAFEKLRLVPKVTRAVFVKYIEKGEISRYHLTGPSPIVSRRELLLQLGIPLQKGDEDLCKR